MHGMNNEHNYLQRVSCACCTLFRVRKRRAKYDRTYRLCCPCSWLARAQLRLAVFARVPIDASRRTLIEVHCMRLCFCAVGWVIACACASVLLAGCHIAPRLTIAVWLTSPPTVWSSAGQRIRPVRHGSGQQQARGCRPAGNRGARRVVLLLLAWVGPGYCCFLISQLLSDYSAGVG